MNKRIYIILFLVIGSLIRANGQDIHFSQYYASPLTLNPATTGVFNGSARIIANYRNQWRTVTPNAFNTISVSADMSLLKRSPGKDYVGLGFVAFYDKAGDGNMGLLNMGFSLAYSKALSRHTKQYLSFGAHFGFTQRRIDYEYLVFNSQFDGQAIGDFSSSREPLTKNKYFNWDNTIGLLWYISATDKMNAYLGGSVAHVNRPNQSFYTDGYVPLYMKFTVHAGMELKTTDQFIILPKLLYVRQGPSQEINIGTTTRLVPNPHNHGSVNSFYVGALYRLSNFNSHDAIVLLAGGEYKNFNLGFTFDLNVSRLVEASYSVGGPEISLTYTIPQLKMRGSSNVRYCPDGLAF